ncbi:hypothetical protein [Cupriavidus alkaliphilus]|uniref:hypothetical protein n=1 Tax=Cupriavidus alkaliphilus TaxID=942866 RepID=UPI00339DA00E
MLKNVLGVIRNNWAMETAGIKIQSLDPKLRIALHKFGMEHGLRPKEVVAFFVKNDLGGRSEPLEAFEIVHEWEMAGEVRTDAIASAKLQYIKQGYTL